MQERGTFGRLGFVLAAAGSAIGLGNIWKFPYITYANEGGTFVLLYLVAIVAFGAPIMFAEILIGRNTTKSPVSAFSALSSNLQKSKAWVLTGWLGIAAGFVILSYYSVVAGWTIYYFGKCLSWSFNGFGPEQAANLGQDFGAFLGNGPLQILFHALFMGATMGVVILGVKGGIERSTKILMPVLFAILVLLCGTSIFTPGFGDAIAFLFHIGPISEDAILEAVGHAFFTLSLGMGAMITYGSYVSKKDSILKASFQVCLLDTVIALMACVIMFSIIFSVPEAERAATFSKSATILFTTLPRMFYELPGGAILSPIFYLLVGFAALSSTISLMEVVVAYFIDEKGWARKKASLLVGTGIFLFGIPSALSLGASEFFSNAKILGDKSTGIFETMDYLASNWLLPVGGLLTALFVGWALPNTFTQAELEEGHGPFPYHAAWKFLLRFICPIGILCVIWNVA